MNGLCRLSRVKSDIAGVAGTTTLDDTLLRAVEAASGELAGECGLSFHATRAARVITVPRACEANGQGAKLWLPWNLASLETLKVDDDGDWSYGLTLVENTDVELVGQVMPNGPYTRIDIHPGSSLISVWPAGQRVQITGLWGWSYELESTGVSCGEELDDSETGIDVTGGTAIDAGETIIVDAEQMYVSVAASTLLTVTRGINGTTAAAHSNAAPIHRRRYPRDVEYAVAERVGGMRWDTQDGYRADGLLGAAGDGTRGRASYGRWRDTIERYRRVSV